MTKLANSCAKNDIINRLFTGESSNKTAKDHFKQQVNKLCANISRSVGIFPVSAPAFMFQKLYQDNSVKTVISERFMKFLDSMAQEDIIEDIENVDNFEE
ncbi:MAG: hypothetical protein MRK02_14910 [Candidatus Scalindua sp.]|nr:hypothetical protein [Candidatus Scalindua sp.]